jgi:hypothetical protein
MTHNSSNSLNNKSIMIFNKLASEHVMIKNRSTSNMRRDIVHNRPIIRNNRRKKKMMNSFTVHQ